MQGDHLRAVGIQVRSDFVYTIFHVKFRQKTGSVDKAYNNMKFGQNCNDFFVEKWFRSPLWW
ncbi:MAG: hypothetical protein D6681_18940 [Calditrichaeota bacterium]|nr:MAG: hypothetical protein D6681_18940 [Calditrichota bacterium]